MRPAEPRRRRAEARRRRVEARRRQVEARRRQVETRRRRVETPRCPLAARLRPAANRAAQRVARRQRSRSRLVNVTDERRASSRNAASLAGELETTQGKSTIAITRDVSAGGLLVFTRLRLEVGTPVKLVVLWQDEQVVVSGKVLRETPVDPTESTLWRSKIAIVVEPDDAGLAKIFAALRES